MRILSSAVLISLALAPAVAAQNQGSVSSITAAPGPITGNFRFTIRGTNPCTAVYLDFGDGSNNTYTINGLPEDTGAVWHHYTRGGQFTVRAAGSGNCRGEATTRVTVNLPTDPTPPPPPPTTPPATARPSDPSGSFATTRFSGMDRNRDTAITRDEWTGSRNSFRFHDWNNDGRLAGDEVRPGAAPPSRGRGIGFGIGALEWTESQFRALDRDRDGGVTRTEWRHEIQDFNRVDRDRNGVLSLEEFLPGRLDDDRGDRFEDVDTNGDNQVEPNEWHGSPEIFRWLDVNGNGAISRGEFEGNEAASNPGAPSRGRARGAVGRTPLSGAFDVSARQAWTDTGIDVRNGDVLVVNASGTIEWADNRGATAPPAGGTGQATPGAPVPRAGIGALVGRVGDAPAFLATGSGGRIRITQTGRLYLGVNDDVLTDNQGAFRVVVTVNR